MPIKAAWQLYKRDVQLAFHDRLECFFTLVFQAIVVGVFPLALSELEALPAIAVGYLWITLLLAMLLGTDQIFKKDAEDGSLYILRQSACPMWLLVLAKVLAHFTYTALPLIILAPIYGVLLGISTPVLPLLCLTLLLGALSMSVVLSLGAAFSLLAQGGAALQVLLVLPLLVPVIIMGPQALHNPGALFGLLALGTLFFTLLPVCAAFVLEMGHE